MTLSKQTKLALILILIWLVVGFLIIGRIVNRSSRHVTQEANRPGPIEQNIPSPPEGR